MALPAAYPGRCEACTEPIHVGQSIERDDESGEWVHADCPPAPTPRPRPICDRCWLEMPCGCEEL